MKPTLSMSSMFNSGTRSNWQLLSCVLTACSVLWIAINRIHRIAQQLMPFHDLGGMEEYYASPVDLVSGFATIDENESLYMMTNRTDSGLETASPDKAVDDKNASNDRADFFQSLRNLRLENMPKIHISELKPPTFDCRDDKSREHCIFENICLQKPGYKRGTWFTTEELQGYSQHPAQIEHKGKLRYTLDIVTKDKEEFSKVNYLADDVYLFNPLHGNRFFIFARAFTLWMITRAYSGKSPYHVLYIAPGGYHAQNNIEMLQPVTYKDEPVYFYPNALQRSKTVCFRRLIFQYPSDHTFWLTGPFSSHATIWSSQRDSADIRQDRMLTKYLPKFREFMLSKYGLTQVAMDPKLAVLVSRDIGPKGQPAYRRIVNEAQLVDVLTNAGFTVDRVDYAQLSHREQMERTRRAALFVGMHGAGMANLVWLHQHAVVLELHTYGFQKFGYERLCHYLSQPYTHWINTDERASVHTWASSQYTNADENVDFYRHRDQIVHIGEFTAVLQGAIALLAADEGHVVDDI